MKIDWEKELAKFHYRDRPTQKKKDDLASMKNYFQGVAGYVVRGIPDCADKMAAIRCLRESLHWCNNAIMQQENKDEAS